MNNFFKALIAGYGAKKLGGGCINRACFYCYLVGAWSLQLIHLTPAINQ